MSTLLSVAMGCAAHTSQWAEAGGVVNTPPSCLGICFSHLEETSTFFQDRVSSVNYTGWRERWVLSGKAYQKWFLCPPDGEVLLKRQADGNRALWRAVETGQRFHCHLWVWFRSHFCLRRMRWGALKKEVWGLGRNPKVCSRCVNVEGTLRLQDKTSSWSSLWAPDPELRKDSWGSITVILVRCSEEWGALQ
jgi:hypothetical protein